MAKRIWRNTTLRSVWRHIWRLITAIFGEPELLMSLLTEFRHDYFDTAQQRFREFIQAKRRPALRDLRRGDTVLWTNFSLTETKLREIPGTASAKYDMAP
jgi:hypothetical protein